MVIWYDLISSVSTLLILNSLDLYISSRVHRQVFSLTFVLNFRWTDGTPNDYNLWGENEPNDNYGAEKCVVIYRPGALPGEILLVGLYQLYVYRGLNL